MFDKQLQKSERGISPIVGVVLILGMTISMAGLLGYIVFDFNEDVGNSADAAVDIEYHDDKVTATVIDPGNVDGLVLEGPKGTEDELTDVEAGDVLEIDEDPMEDGQYTLLGLVEDEEQILQTENFEFE